jgi:hypothetical protein
VALGFPHPMFGCGGSLFFGLGCFSVCVGMRGWFFCPIRYVGVCWVGWDEEACWLFVFWSLCEGCSGWLFGCCLCFDLGVCGATRLGGWVAVAVVAPTDCKQVF